MISVKCPHCKVGLKVDETKIPIDITSFKCPKCKQDISLSYIKQKKESSSDVDTVVVLPKGKKEKTGCLTVLPNEYTLSQEYRLKEGLIIVGRKAKGSTADVCIDTNDKTMSRSHICIEIQKKPKTGYFHYLSDNNSKNNTLYNGKCIESGEKVVLKDNDEITMGRTVVRFNT